MDVLRHGKQANVNTNKQFVTITHLYSDQNANNLYNTQNYKSRKKNVKLQPSFAKSIVVVWKIR